MRDRLLIKVALGCLLVGAGLVQPARNTSTTVELVMFGILNLFLAVPGTLQVRAAAFVLALTAVLLPQIRWLVIFTAWLVWLPAFAVAAQLGHDESDRSGPPAQTSTLGPKITLTAVIAAAALGSIAYRLLTHRHLEQTAMLFVGIPALMAVVVVFFVSPRSATGVACKAVTLGLLVSLILLWEGMLCVLFAAPLFFAVAITVAQGMQAVKRDIAQKRVYSALFLIALAPFTLEGVAPITTVARDETVAVSRIVHASADAVSRAVFQPPRFERVPSRYLRIGFPAPTQTRIERCDGHLRWIVEVRGGEMRINGMEPRTGELILELVERQPNFVRWRAVSDTSHMTHFLRWREAAVQWNAVDAHSVRVTWTIHYERGLDPAWYFGPLERYMIGLAADYLIDTVALP